jgi:hypothetical protein
LTVIDKVDLLFMVDNSNSTGAEQAMLAEQLPRLIEALTAGDANPADGITRGADFRPVRSLNLGVITSDMGVGGYPIPTCLSAIGDDGMLRARGNVAVDPSCGELSQPFLSFDPSREDAETFAARASCLLVAGTNGCGFEQPLEAILKAVTSSTQGPVGAFDGRFARGTSGHADGANAGFSRPDSVLAIVAMADEDDCSARDPELFNPSSTVYTAPLNLRCFEHASALHPIERYVDGLLATRGWAEQLVFALLAGVPPDAASEPDVPPDYDAILSHPDMQVRVDPDMPMRLHPSCSDPGTSFAFPPRRLVEVARALDARGVVTAAPSLCEPDWTAAFDAILNAIAVSLFAECIGDDLGADAEGRIPCDVLEMLPEVTARCADLPGRTFAYIDEDTGAEVCRIEQLTAHGEKPDGAGFYYDTFSPLVLRVCAAGGAPAARIAFTDEGQPTLGSSIRIECIEPVDGSCVAD